MTTSLKPIAILGAGSWGTALALYLARRGQVVRLWSHESSEIEALLANRENRQFLPGHRFPDEIQPTSNLRQAILGVDDILIAIPSAGFRQTLILLKPVLHEKVRILCATKGIDAEKDQFLHEVINEILGERYPASVLSGPTFAREVAAGLPAAALIAGRDHTTVMALQQRFNSPIFHIEISDDVIGVEAGGVIKNVIAIATGMIDGLQLGANARAALMTRGFAEMMQIGTHLGGRPETFIGLSGLGDLILTALDDQSRNRRLGLALGRGASILEAEKQIGQAIEGKRNAQLIVELASRRKLEAPLSSMILNILQGKAEVRDLIAWLF
ncbi:MAG: glycerol-3-phosphate dehydrogenase [Gammaproteobacteria bacterium RIFCSPHIGHO2_12_FULL_42_10]|nr:MAG: glycerol-3-phosphate dehydrogenase [Gammaproteobacteria bacterium RIFCSPHIGHO2_12_FULL_42_10]